MDIKEAKARKNEHDLREAWLGAALKEIRNDFKGRELLIPDNIRLSTGFPGGGRKSKRKGDCLPAEASADGHFEVIVGSNEDDPVAILAELEIQLLHVVFGPKGNRRFREGLASLGFDVRDGIRGATPGSMLLKRLNEIAAALGPFPHAKIDWSKATTPTGKPRKQTTRNLKATCTAPGKDGEACGYLCHVSAKWARDPGPPHCPLHGATVVEWEDEKPGKPSTIVDAEFEEVNDTQLLIGREAAE